MPDKFTSLKFISIYLLSLCFSFFSYATANDLQAVDDIDLSRYAGHWYEIASIPQLFQKGCSCTSATYELRDDGKVKVTNRCRRLGIMTQIEGVAAPVDDASQARLRVDFGFGSPGSYVVIGLDPEYRYAVVSSEDQRALWVLSRERVLKPELFGKAMETAARQVDLTDLTVTEQRGCPPIE